MRKINELPELPSVERYEKTNRILGYYGSSPRGAVLLDAHNVDQSGYLNDFEFEKESAGQRSAHKIKGTKTLNQFERNHLLQSLQLMKKHNLTLEKLEETLM